jgi:hypothetical protein
MRRCRAVLAAVLLTLITMTVAGPASAGGPTSVLLVVPGTGQTASLYTGDADYETLARVVGAFGTDGGAQSTDQSGEDGQFGTGVTVTWLIHDVQVWRVDRVFVGAGGPRISTRVSVDGSSSIWEVPVAWHQPTNGKQLVDLLDRLGVNPDSSTGGGGATAGSEAAGPTPAESVPPAADRAAANTASRDVSGSGTRGTAGWLWGLAGLTLGAVLTLAALRLLASTRAAPSNLVPTDADGDDATDGPESDGALSWSVPDELSSPARRG